MNLIPLLIFISPSKYMHNTSISPARFLSFLGARAETAFYSTFLSSLGLPLTLRVPGLAFLCPVVPTFPYHLSLFLGGLLSYVFCIFFCVLSICVLFCSSLYLSCCASLCAYTFPQIHFGSVFVPSLGHLIIAQHLFLNSREGVRCGGTYNQNQNHQWRKKCTIGRPKVN